MSFISSFEIIKVVVPQPCIFFWNPASTAEAAVVIPNGAKLFFATGTATFINGPAILLSNEPKKPPKLVILDIWVLDSFIPADKMFSNAFLGLVFCLAVNNNL